MKYAEGKTEHSFTRMNYKLFWEFMGCAALPDYVLHIEPIGDGFVERAWVKHDETTAIPNLHIRKYFHRLGKRALPILYHEFTHIYDYEYPDKKLRNSAIQFTWSEFHASQVQTMVYVGYESHDDVKSFASSTPVECLEKYNVIADSISNNIELFNQVANEYHSNKTFENKVTAFRHMMYTAGIQNMFLRYCSDENYKTLRSREVKKALGKRAQKIWEMYVESTCVSIDTMLHAAQLFVECLQE